MTKKQKRIIINAVAIAVIIVGFFIINIKIYQRYKQRVTLTADVGNYVYDIDSFYREGDLLIIRGWFFELINNNKALKSTSKEDDELLIALIPLDKAIIGSVVEGASVMNVERMHEDRPDINEYFSCEYDYSKCGFVATIDYDDIDLKSNAYRIAVKQDANMSSKAVLTNLYISDKGLSYTDPRQSPELDTEGTDLERIVTEGVRLLSRPDVSCYVYQLGDKLYWIADEGFEFCQNNSTYIQYQMNTTQIDRLPSKRIENNWLWSNMGGYFERYEITDLINCGKYRVSMRNIPREYSVTSVTTGYHDGKNWTWKEMFKLDYKMLE